jgi:uncharacterized surface protein with fasciclin (FAS1) repeats
MQKRIGKVLLFALAAIMLLSLPLAAAAQTPPNGITAPAAGAQVSGVTEVTGNANDPNFQKWQLDLLPGGNSDAAIFLALGETPGAAKYVLNTVPLPNGEHALRLRVVRNDGNYDEYTSKFTIANGTATTKPAATSTTKASDIVTTAIDAGQFKTLVAAVQAAGLTKTLQGKGPFTVFAPTDAAFAKLPAGTVDSLLKDPKALSNILLYHVVPGAVKASAVKDGLSVKTAQGSNVTFKMSPGGAPMINDANITATDIIASNGIIHVIDSVIMPPTTATAAPVTTSTTTMAENGITAPAAGATVSGTVDVKGHAMDPNLSKWQLDVLPGGDANGAIFQAVGTDHGDFTYKLDTTALPNGEHALRLRVVRSDGNYDEYVSKFTIANK